MKKHTLKVEKRKILGRKVKKLRKQGILPANIYGKKIKSLAIQVKKSEFQALYKKVGETGLIELLLGSLKKPALIHNVQTDPINEEPLHLDFLQVNLREKVSTAVPIEIVGEPPAEKSGKGIMVVQLNEVEVEALAKNLPEKFIVDVTKLSEVDQAVLVKDLTYDKKKIKIKDDESRIIVKIEAPRKEEEKVAPLEEEVPEAEMEAPEPEAEMEEEKVEKREKTKEKKKTKPSETEKT